jgi:hypothetical protein
MQHVASERDSDNEEPGRADSAYSAATDVTAAAQMPARVPIRSAVDDSQRDAAASLFGGLAKQAQAPQQPRPAAPFASMSKPLFAGQLSPRSKATASPLFGGMPMDTSAPSFAFSNAAGTLPQNTAKPVFSAPLAAKPQLSTGMQGHSSAPCAPQPFGLLGNKPGSQGQAAKQPATLHSGAMAAAQAVRLDMVSSETGRTDGAMPGAFGGMQHVGRSVTAQEQPRLLGGMLDTHGTAVGTGKMAAKLLEQMMAQQQQQRSAAPGVAPSTAEQSASDDDRDDSASDAGSHDSSVDDMFSATGRGNESGSSMSSEAWGTAFGSNSAASSLRSAR